MKKSYLPLAALALLLLIALSISPAMAYFSDYTTADGAQEVNAGFKTEIEEEFESWTKKVTIKNTSDDLSVYVRAKVFSMYNVKCNGTNWTPTNAGNETYVYYTPALAPKKSAAVLNVEITHPTTPEEGDSFNVVVIYEAVPARYDEDGTPYADWNQEVLTFTEKG